MKLIIAGSRNLGNRLEWTFIEDLIMEFKIGHPKQVISGGATGIDALGEEYAKGINTELIIFSADWKQYGKFAGPKRNREMAEYADALLLIWDGKSRGSSNIKSLMRHLNKPIYEVVLNFPE